MSQALVTSPSGADKLRARFTRLSEVLLYVGLVTTGYMNMLIVMTYNPGLMMAVVIGEVCAYCSVLAFDGHRGAVQNRSLHEVDAGDIEVGGASCH
jgi:hypothetical protein